MTDAIEEFRDKVFAAVEAAAEKLVAETADLPGAVQRTEVGIQEMATRFANKVSSLIGTGETTPESTSAASTSASPE